MCATGVTATCSHGRRVPCEPPGDRCGGNIRDAPWLRHRQGWDSRGTRHPCGCRRRGRSLHAWRSSADTRRGSRPDDRPGASLLRLCRRRRRQDFGRLASPICADATVAAVAEHVASLGLEARAGPVDYGLTSGCALNRADARVPRGSDMALALDYTAAHPELTDFASARNLRHALWMYCSWTDGFDRSSGLRGARQLYIAHNTVVGVDAVVDTNRQVGRIVVGYDRQFVALAPKSVPIPPMTTGVQERE